MKTIIEATLAESIAVKRQFIADSTSTIISISQRIADAMVSGHKVLLFGNGGSAADAQHIAAEFVNRFAIERPPLAAIALTTDTSILTSIGNDYSFEEIFSKQIRALGRKDDVAVGISTSGNSPNVIAAMTAAAEIGMTTIGFSGARGRLPEVSDICMKVSSKTTARIQECHILAAHIICDLVDRILFPKAYVEGAS
ncbi:MAG: D-sedoheptulose 7-phosphate isomerase [Pseudomonadota bacterium]